MKSYLSCQNLAKDRSESMSQRILGASHSIWRGCLGSAGNTFSGFSLDIPVGSATMLRPYMITFIFCLGFMSILYLIRPQVCDLGYTLVGQIMNKLDSLYSTSAQVTLVIEHSNGQLKNILKLLICGDKMILAWIFISGELLGASKQWFLEKELLICKADQNVCSLLSIVYSSLVVFDIQSPQGNS